MVCKRFETLKKIFQLIKAIRKNPFEGLGKPEALKYGFKGYWSRRINEEHRLIYEVTDVAIIIHATRYHYR
ncbi:MAG: Txe/YoeB family addiction module toxin [Segetibacter sp.]